MNRYFTLFDLPPDFDIDAAALESRYRALAAQCHPDKFAAKSSFEQKQAVMMATTVNEAYRILKNPIDRAAYLLRENSGIDADAPQHTAVDTEFLLRQMQWREALEDGSGNEAALLRLQTEVAEAAAELCRRLSRAFAEQAYQTAANCVRQGRFIDKLQQQIRHALP